MFRSSLALISLVAVALGLGACGGSRKRPTTGVPAASASAATSGGAASSGSTSAATVRTANCMLWNVLDPPARRRIVVGLRMFFGQRLDAGARLRLLPDQKAYRIITSYCRLPFARAFLIYRLYGNATGFGGQR